MRDSAGYIDTATFKMINPDDEQSDNIFDHLGSQHCLLKTIRRLITNNNILLPSSNIQLEESNQSLLFGHVEELVIHESLYDFQSFLKSNNGRLTSIHFNNFVVEDAKSFWSNEIKPNLQLAQRLQTLLFDFNMYDSDDHGQLPVYLEAVQLPNVRRIRIRGDASDFTFAESLLKQLHSLTLGCKRSFTAHHIQDPEAFFGALKMNDQLTTLKLRLSNMSGYNDYKPAFLDFLRYNQSLTSLSVGFIRDRSIVELISSNRNLQQLKIQTNETDIDFGYIRRLTISSRRDSNIYHMLCTMVGQTTCALTSLHLKFYQFYHSSCYTIIKALPTLISGMTSLCHLTIEICGHVPPTLWINAMCAWGGYSGNLETLTLKSNAQQFGGGLFRQTLLVLESGLNSLTVFDNDEQITMIKGKHQRLVPEAESRHPIVIIKFHILNPLLYEDDYKFEDQDVKMFLLMWS
ncbi:hypothetical protein SAMD00019534_044900 [Acytostelium subglobosum LB1]|uniref:hypothetical protein n=1 Tax=Acytostelium subglobosum LB1 TaxID=1410327 RepID=UPI000644B223|nr:hypothetical protein SAMD00019534_044900 [Acytostelium subglobosum LB1]GAM21315.1 hypothetical protein SAMD00019534_044900 [Acytostelium subglobosum LB1]|eukprot:XP_012755434.1 hypothetical protein SAMD00019534_044900 [Acytostelium subglobosum LB1]